MASPRPELTIHRGRSWGGAGAAWLLGLIGLTSCVTSTEHDGVNPGTGDPGDVVTPTPTSTSPGDPTPDGSCVSPEEGCTCATEGATVDCAETRIKTPTYVSCAHGTRRCGEGKWGECVIANDAPITSQSLIGLMGLGSSTKCTNNPCDPYCSQVTDSATGLDAGVDSGLAVDSGVLTLDGQPAPDAGPGCSALVVVPGQTTVTVKPGPAVYVTGGLRGEYFNQYSTTNIDPAWDATGSRVDPVIDFSDWGSVGPGITGIGTSNFSVRWSGKVKAPVTGTYTFETATDDAVRLWVNNTLLIDKWITQGTTVYTNTIGLTQGQSYDIKMEYNQGTGGAAARLRWSATAEQPTLSTDVAGGLLGEYFSQYSSSITSVPSTWVATGKRIDAGVNFDWGGSAPGVSTVPADNFTVRWSGKVKTTGTAGTYTFRTRTDDGVRLWVNGTQLINKWVGQGATDWTGTITLAANTLYDIRMEYFDSGGSASAVLAWKPPGGTDAVIPPANLFNRGGGTSQAFAMQTPDPSLLSSLNPQASFVFDPPTVPLQAQLQPTNCYPGEFKPAWSISRPDLASVDTSGVVTPVSAVAGPLQVKAYGGSLIGQSTVNVVVKFADTSRAPAGVTNESFTTSTTPDVMTVVYPYVDTVFPLALRAPVVQWYPNGQAASAVRVSLRYPATGTPVFDVGIVSAEGSPAKLSIPQGYWQAFEQTAKGQEAAIVVQRLIGGVPRQEVVRKFRFASAELRGRIYYTQYDQTTSAASQLVIDPGSTAGPINLFNGGSGCPVCHTVSASGNRMATSDWGQNGFSNGLSRLNANGTADNLGTIPETSQGNPVNSTYRANASDWRGFAWAPLTPDGTYALAATNIWGNTGGGYIKNGASSGNNGNGTDYFIWRSPDSPGGALVDATSESPNRWGLQGAVMMVPSFSPDGKKLVFLNGDGTGGSGWRKGLSTFDFNQSAKTFTNRRLIYNTWPNGLVMKWPTFESDSRSVIFQTSDNWDSNGYNRPDGTAYYIEYGSMAPTNKGTIPGQLWSIDATAASPQAVPLTKLNKGERAVDTNKSYQATMLPKAAGGYRWVVFTSTRPYGVTLNTPESVFQPDYSNPSSYVAANNAQLQAQLWVAAIDDQGSAATDRSHPAFWLPNQNPRINERGFWVLDPCIPVGTGSANLCSTTEQCCGSDAGTVSCQLDTPVNASSPTRHCRNLASVGSCGPLGSTCAVDSDCCSGLLCSSSDGKCVSPPPITLYAPSNYDRSPDFDGAVCPQGTRVVWRTLEWQSKTPLDSYIEFFVQTAEKQTDFLTVPLAPNPVGSTSIIPVGKASGPDTTGWTMASDNLTIDQRLTALGRVSGRFLRLTARLVPSTNKVAAPGLVDWRVSYSCVPSE